jgi:predicted nucleotidyltransferase
MIKTQIDPAVRETILSILRKYGATKIAIFGSYARGEERADSDIDILVRFDSPKSLFQLVRIEDELKEALQRPVDLITEKSISPYLSDPIHHDEVVIFG